MSESRSEATLIVVRQRTLQRNMGPLAIHVDGRLCGKVGEGDFAAIACSPGTFEVHVGEGWCRSRSLTIALPPGGQAEVMCRLNLPRNLFARPAKFVFLGLAAFAALYVLVPSIKPALMPYEHIWGLIFLVLIGLSLLALYSEMIPTLLATLSRQPGKYVDLATQEPTITDEMILKQPIESLALTGHF